MLGLQILDVAEEEAEYLAKSLAKILASRKRQRAARKIEKRGPWLALLLAVGAIYGPRLIMLWQAMQKEKTKSRLRVVPIGGMPQAEGKSDSAVN